MNDLVFVLHSFCQKLVFIFENSSHSKICGFYNSLVPICFSTFIITIFSNNSFFVEKTYLEKSRMCVRDVLEITNFTNCRT